MIFGWGSKDKKPSLDSLTDVPFLKNLDRLSLQTLIEVGNFIKFAPAKTIMSEGDIGDSAYIILSGRVDVKVASSKSEGHVISSLSRGEVFGELALLSETNRTATVISTEETVILEISKDIFLNVLEQNPVAAEAMLTTLSERLSLKG